MPPRTSAPSGSTRSARASTSPGAFPVAGDLVEALSELGQLDEAHAVTERLKALAGDDHPWAHATLAGRGLRQEPEARRRRRSPSKRSACASTPPARSSPTAAPCAARASGVPPATRSKVRRAAFETLGSPGWVGQAKAELTRVGGRRPRDAGELTETERQVARLAAARTHEQGDRAALFVTVHTVEAHLSSTYAKLGVQTRTQLAARPLKIGDPGDIAGGAASVRSPAVTSPTSLLAPVTVTEDTTLLDAVARFAASAGWLTRRSRRTEDERFVPYVAVRELFGDASSSVIRHARRADVP